MSNEEGVPIAIDPVFIKPDDATFGSNRRHPWTNDRIYIFSRRRFRSRLDAENKVNAVLAAVCEWHCVIRIVVEKSDCDCTVPVRRREFNRDSTIRIFDASSVDVAMRFGKEIPIELSEQFLAVSVQPTNKGLPNKVAVDNVLGDRLARGKAIVLHEA